MRILFILGTRPEIIKMSPVIMECQRLGLDYSVVHTGQHYANEMNEIFFKELRLPPPEFYLGIKSNSHGKQTGKMLMKIEEVLMKEKPDFVLVQGDTNSTLAGAVAATKLGIKVGHVEAGLRSYNRKMPEEINRVLTDHCSDLLFAPTHVSMGNLLHEGILKEKIFLTGNTIVDVIYEHLELAQKIDMLNVLGLKPQKYFLATVHRQENVDDKGRFCKILQGLDKVSHEFGLPIIYPIHPRSRKRMKEFDLRPDDIRIVGPKSFYEFLQLESNAKLVLTDSGGVQEESCILKVPCVTLRDNTERPETIDVGSNILAGTDPNKILECARIMVSRAKNWENPFGEGNAGKKIIETLINTG
jgi:UDP-N-acetylglucosamine 2-epimerase (non-hydrolysing)